MKPRVDHIHITVEDLGRAEKFYDRLLPLLGFDTKLKEADRVPSHEYKIVEYHHNLISIGLVNQRKAYSREKPSRRKARALHHLAFHAENREEVDAVYEEVRKLPAEIVHKPQYYPDYCPDYYAFFFKDSEGIEYEVTSFDRDRYFPA